MIDRVSIFSDPEIVALLTEKFVPLAVDQHIERQRRDPEGDFFRKVLAQAGRRPDGRAQGLYAFTADGRLLEFSNTLSREHARRLLRSALQKFDPTAVLPLDELQEPPKDGRPDSALPDDVTIVDVTAKVLGGYPEAEPGSHQAIMQQSLGRDRLWLRQDEVQALERGTMPPSLAARIARFHLVDNTRGEPPFWRADELRKVEMTLAERKLRGQVHLETASGDRGFDGELLGVVDAQRGTLERFDVVASGRFWGHGTYTRNPPPGRFPFAVSFRLADPDCEASRIAPGAARSSWRGYLS